MVSGQDLRLVLVGRNPDRNPLCGVRVEDGTPAALSLAYDSWVTSVKG